MLFYKGIENFSRITIKPSQVIQTLLGLETLVLRARFPLISVVSPLINFSQTSTRISIKLSRRRGSHLILFLTKFHFAFIWKPSWSASYYTIFNITRRPVVCFSEPAPPQTSHVNTGWKLKSARQSEQAWVLWVPGLARLHIKSPFSPHRSVLRIR